MKTNQHPPLTAALRLLIAGLLLLAVSASARERVAQLSKVDGKVQVTRSETQKVDDVVLMGTRVRGGSLYTGDQITTGPEATATVVFSDGTIVDLEADTVVAVLQTDESKLMAAGKVDKPIGRTIQLVAGEIFSDIAHNEMVSTRFATPSGVAAVKGTRIRLSVDPEEGTEKETE